MFVSCVQTQSMYQQNFNLMGRFSPFDPSPSRWPSAWQVLHSRLNGPGKPPAYPGLSCLPVVRRVDSLLDEKVVWIRLTSLTQRHKHPNVCSFHQDLSCPGYDLTFFSSSLPPKLHGMQSLMLALLERVPTLSPDTDAKVYVIVSIQYFLPWMPSL